MSVPPFATVGEGDAGGAGAAVGVGLFGLGLLVLTHPPLRYNQVLCFFFISFIVITRRREEKKVGKLGFLTIFVISN